MSGLQELTALHTAHLRHNCNCTLDVRKQNIIGAASIT